MAKTKVEQPDQQQGRRKEQDRAGVMDWGWLTQIAFGLLIALVLARATMLEAPSQAGETVRGAGPTASLVLDLLCCVPAFLILTRRLFDRTYVVRWTWSFVLMGLLALWMALSVRWSAGRFQAATSASHVIAGLVVLWSAAQLVRSWQRLRLVAAVLIGLLVALSAYGILYKLVEAPDTIRYFEQHKAEILRDRGLEPGTFQAEQFERKVSHSELMGFTASANSFAALVVLVMMIGVGWVVQRARDNEESDPLLLLMPAVLALGVLMLIWAESRTAFATLALGLLLFVAVWLTRNWLGARSRLAYLLGVVLVVLGAAGVIGVGLARGNLVHSSLTFRWNYWIGSMRMFLEHPVRGVGWNNFSLYYLAARVPQASEEIKDPHNFIVRFFVELGAIGGILLVAWMLRLWWELTRPNVPPATVAAVGTRSRPLLVVAGFCVLAYVINVVASLDFGLDSGFVLLMLAQRAMYFALLYVAAVATTVKSLQEARGDDRPAPWVLYGMLIALGLFLVHNLVDFSLFENGPLMVFALAAGSALGVRFGSVAGQRRHKRVAGIALAVAAALWAGATLALAIPTADAEQIAVEAHGMIRRGQYRQASELLNEAFGRQPGNSDYAADAADAAIRDERAGDFLPRAKAFISQAIKANPRVERYYLRRAKWEMMSAEPDARQVEADYQQAVKLNPNDVPLHLEFARAMIKLGQVDRAIEQFEAAIGASQGMEKADLRRNDAPVHVEFALALERMKRWPEAKRQYQAALDYSQPLPEGDRRKLSQEERERIEGKIRELESRPATQP